MIAHALSLVRLRLVRKPVMVGVVVAGAVRPRDSPVAKLLAGRMTATFLRGGLAWDDGHAVGPARGRYVRRPA